MSVISSLTRFHFNPLLTPTTTKMAGFNLTFLESKLFGSQFHCSQLSKSHSHFSSSHVKNGGYFSSPFTSAKAQVLQMSRVDMSEKVNSKPNQKDTNFEETYVISLHGMQKANSSLEDFCRSYFMFHGMDINSPQTLFEVLPILMFTESYLYQLDDLNESLTSYRGGVLEGGKEMQEGKEKWIAKQMQLFKIDPYGPLVAQLESQGLLTERIMEQFEIGLEYWNLERNLCFALAHGKKISVDEAIRTMCLKSTDYRIMNLLLYKMRGEKVNDLHMEFLSYSEFLMEVSDDLNYFPTWIDKIAMLMYRLDYEDDVIKNNFNILRMFVKIYGPTEATIMLSKYIVEAQEKYDFLNNALDPQLSLNYQRRRNEVIAKEGGKISTQGHPFGMASIPPIVADEELHRSNYLNSK